MEGTNMKSIPSLIYSVLILLVVSTSACNPDVSSSSKTSILDNPVCSPPCWQNIVPGKTNRVELLATLASIANFDQSSIAQQDYSNMEGYNQFIHGNLYLEPNELTLVSAYLSEEMVLVLNFSGKLNLTLEEAIEGFGEPEWVLIYHSNFTVVTFLIPSKGIAFRFDTLGENWGPVDSIVPEMEIKDIDYFSPDYYYEILDMGWFSEGKWNYQESVAQIKPWKGYGSIDILYK
jgi:hypothetical protein